MRSVSILYIQKELRRLQEELEELIMKLEEMKHE
jgi:hypothetical protein